MTANKKPNILIVDDQVSIRTLIRVLLEAEGYRVSEAGGGKDAIRITADPEAEIDILITDILMPQMNGKDLANRVSAIRPFIKVLFVSAYTAEILNHHDLCPEGADIIRKPFTREVLLDRVSRIWAVSPVWKTLVSKQA
ncbi:MAG: sensor histidine kinase response regulator [Fibrobacteres bacterium]|nr:sensor histidine kinase response regulator [Fibrobacterota bacterium]